MLTKVASRGEILVSMLIMSSARVSCSVTRMITTSWWPAGLVPRQVRACMHMLPCSVMHTTAVALIIKQPIYYCCIIGSIHTWNCTSMADWYTARQFVVLPTHLYCQFCRESEP
jgi:hypothetical protein